jgi:hypothetical protein
MNYILVIFIDFFHFFEFEFFHRLLPLGTVTVPQR